MNFTIWKSVYKMQIFDDMYSVHVGYLDADQIDEYLSEIQKEHHSHIMTRPVYRKLMSLGCAISIRETLNVTLKSTEVELYVGFTEEQYHQYKEWKAYELFMGNDHLFE